LLNLISKPKISLIAEYGYIDIVEKRMLATSNLEYVFNTHQEITFNFNNISFDSSNNTNGLVKEMYYFSRLMLNKNGITRYSKSELNKFTDYSILPGNILENIEINIGGDNNLIEFNTIENLYNNVLAFSYLNSNLPEGVYYKSFSLFPHQYQPSGSINMTEIESNINIELDETQYNEYTNNKNNPNKLGIEFKIIYTKYNLLCIKNGQGELLFYS
jgi:hypothetical protein